MKKFLLLAVLSVSATESFAQRRVIERQVFTPNISTSVSYGASCYADMIYLNNRVIRSYAGFDCQEAMKECRKSIRMEYSANPRYANQNLDCVAQNSRIPDTRIPDNRIPDNNRPHQPDWCSPSQGCNTPPTDPRFPDNRIPDRRNEGRDFRRMVGPNEVVYLNSRSATILGISMSGIYAVRTTDTWGSTVTLNNIVRESLAVTNACNGNLCTDDNAISVTTGRDLVLLAVGIDGRFVVRTTDTWGSSVTESNIDPTNIASKTGCVNSAYTQLCVGNQVINTSNRYGTVIGIQMDGRVVLKTTDTWGSSIVQTNVDSSTLVITR